MRDDKRVEGRDELDGRIDDALRSYAEPSQPMEPRIALARIMDRAQSARPARGIRWWMWGVAGAAACLVAVMVAMWMTRGPQAPEIARAPAAPGVVSVSKRSAPAAVQGVANRRATHAGWSTRHKEVAATATTLPKLAVFPTPRPLSPEEEALVAFAKHGPPAVLHAVLEDQKQWDEPGNQRPGSQQDQ
jgi:hypothetical protein